MVAAVEDIDIVLGVDPNRADFLERPAVRQLRPILDDAVFEVATANDDRHVRPSANMPRPTLTNRPALNNPSATRHLTLQASYIGLSNGAPLSHSPRSTPSQGPGDETP